MCVHLNMVFIIYSLNFMEEEWHQMPSYLSVLTLYSTFSFSTDSSDMTPSELQH